ncbi:hypothetical protein CHUAL_013209 [Chamberlinius hualienensis]
MSRHRVQTKFIDEDTVKRGENWTPEATTYLIELWREYFPQLRGQRRTLPIYTKIQKRLSDKSIQKSVTEIKNRINNLNQRYRKEKSKLNEGRTTWQHFDAIDVFLGSNHANDRPVPENFNDMDGNMFVSCELMESSDQLSINDSFVSESDDPSGSLEEHKPKRQRISSSNDDTDILRSMAETQKTLVNILAQSQRAQEKFQNQFIAFQRDFMDIMRTYMQNDKI